MMFKRVKKSASLMITPQAVHYLVLREAKGEQEVIDSGTVEYDITDESSLADTINHLSANFDCPWSLSVSCPTRNAMVSTPPMTLSDLESSIPLQAEKLFGMQERNLQLAWEALDSDAGSSAQQHNVLLIALCKSQIAKFIEEFGSLDLRPNRLEPALSSFARATVKLLPRALPAGCGRAHLHFVSRGETNCAFFAVSLKDKLLYLRTLPLAPNASKEEVSEHLNQSLLALEDKYPMLELDALQISGESLQEEKEFIAGRCALPLENLECPLAGLLENNCEEDGWVIPYGNLLGVKV